MYMSGIWAGELAAYYRGVVNTERSIQRFDPKWLEDPRLRASLAVQDVQALFRWLHARGWSQGQIGAATGQSQPEVSAILKGRQVKAHAVLLRIAQGLGIPPGYMRLGSCVACDGDGGPDASTYHLEEDDPMFRRQFLAAAGAIAADGAMDGVSLLFPSPASPVRAVPARVGAAEVAQVRSATACLRALDYQHGHGTSLDAARGLAGWAHGMLSSPQSRATARDLRIALADLHALIAWAFGDAGRSTGARRHHIQALTLAREADEPGMVGTILADVARVSVDSHDPREGIKLAGFGLLATAEDGISPAIRAALHLEDAWARAHLADERGSLDALSRAGDDLARTDPAAVPPWASGPSWWLKAGAHAGFRGRVYQELARTPAFRRYAETAIQDAETAIASADLSSLTADLMTRISLSTGLLRVGEWDAGVTTANQLLDQAGALASNRIRAQLADISTAARAHAGHPNADDLRAHIAALAAA
jgi:transcriptional regulator with XRE-family HTH domain